MTGLATEGSQFDIRQYDKKTNELLQVEKQGFFFTCYDEVYDAYGFENPPAIQQRGIVPFHKGLNAIQQAQSGTGETATSCSGIKQQLEPKAARIW